MVILQWSQWLEWKEWITRDGSSSSTHRTSIWECAKLLCRMAAWLIATIIRKYVITLYSLPKGKHSFKEHYCFLFFFPSRLNEDCVLFKESENDLGDILEKIMPATDWLASVNFTCIQTWIFKWLSHKLGVISLFSFDVSQMVQNYFMFSAGQMGHANFLLNVQHNISYIN